MRCPLLCIEKSDNDNHEAFIGSMSYGLCHGSCQKMNDSYDMAHIPMQEMSVKADHPIGNYMPGYLRTYGSVSLPPAYPCRGGHTIRPILNLRLQSVED